MKRFLLTVLALMMVVVVLAGCDEAVNKSAEPTPLPTFAPEEQQLLDTMLTIDIKTIRFKSEYEDGFDKQYFSSMIRGGFRVAVRWYRTIKQNLYVYEDGTVRINFHKTLAYMPYRYYPALKEYSEYELGDPEPGVLYFHDAMREYKIDTDKATLNDLEKELADILNYIGVQIRWIGSRSNDRIKLEEKMRTAEAKGKTYELSDAEETSYSVCKMLESNIHRLEEYLLELAAYLDVVWGDALE